MTRSNFWSQEYINSIRCNSMFGLYTTAENCQEFTFFHIKLLSFLPDLKCVSHQIFKYSKYLEFQHKHQWFSHGIRIKTHCCANLFLQGGWVALCSSGLSGLPTWSASCGAEQGALSLFPTRPGHLRATSRCWQITWWGRVARIGH